MPFLNLQKDRSRLPEPNGRQGIDLPLARYLNDLIKTIKGRFESLEGEVDVNSNRDKVETVSDVLDFEMGFDSFIFLADANVGDIVFYLPDPLEAFNANAVYTIREIGGVNSIFLTAVNGELIEGLSSYVVSPNTAKTIVSDGANWYIIST